MTPILSRPGPAKLLFFFSQKSRNISCVFTTRYKGGKSLSLLFMPLYK